MGGRPGARRLSARLCPRLHPGSASACATLILFGHACVPAEALAMGGRPGARRLSARLCPRLHPGSASACATLILFGHACVPAEALAMGGRPGARRLPARLCPRLHPGSSSACATLILFGHACVPAEALAVGGRPRPRRLPAAGRADATPRADVRRRPASGARLVGGCVRRCCCGARAGAPAGGERRAGARCVVTSLDPCSGHVLCQEAAPACVGA